MTSYHLAAGRLVTGRFLPGGVAVRERTLRPAERAAKRRMLSRYVTQREVLAPFDVDVERFRERARDALRTLGLEAPPIAERA